MKREARNTISDPSYSPHLAVLYELSWPVARMGEAIEALARQSGLVRSMHKTLPSPEALGTLDDAGLMQWVDAAADVFNLEVEPVDVIYSELQSFLKNGGPVIIRLSIPDQEHRYLALLKSSRRTAAFITPDFSIRRVSLREVRAALSHHLEGPFLAYTEEMLSQSGVPQERRSRTRNIIMQEMLGQQRMNLGWLLRLSPGAGLWSQLRHYGIPRLLTTILAVVIIEQLLQIGAWWMVGISVFAGYFDWSLLLAWGLILLTTVPFQVLLIDVQGRIVISIGAYLKKRLLAGTLKLDPEEIRHLGVGQFLGRVMDSEAIEMLGLGGGFSSLILLVNLGIAFATLTLGAGGWLHALALALWVALTLVLGYRYFRRGVQWTDSYRTMSNDLVERMVGYRTRLAQENRRTWHQEEDRLLDHYLKLSTSLDRLEVRIDAIIPHGWLLFGLTSLVVINTFWPASQVRLAISLGGVLMAYQVLTALIMGIQSLVAAVVSWNQIAPLYHAAGRPRQTRSLDYIAPASSQDIIEAGSSQSLLAANDITFRYRQHGRPVLNHCALKINRGDRLLLEGPSGGGKSTLAAVLTGLRAPESGLMLLGGIDQSTLGAEEWRRRVVTAPQFQENHVFTETLAFNLLLGRNWPPQPGDLEEAESILIELGLGELLEKMPAGFQQIVGESGWQLSHGERSRIFIARALLQKADLIILDESFGALDPDNLSLALQCALKRARTLLVIAHP